MNIDHLSASSIEMFQRCPRQWRFRYVEGLKMPPSVAIVQGASVHASAEHNYAYKVETQEDLPADEILDVCRDRFQAEAEAVEDWEDTGPGKALDQTVTLASLYHSEFAPTVHPIEVEREFVLSDPSWEFHLLGYIDVEEESRVIDIKTSSRSKPADEIDTSLQAGIYQLARHREGKPDRFDWHVLVKTKTPTTQTFTRGKVDHEQTVRTVAAVQRAIVVAMKEDCFPPGPAGWRCSSKQCGYWRICEFGGAQ